MDLKPIPDLKVCGNKAKNWEIFFNDFQDYLVAKNTKFNDSCKLALLRNQIGTDGKEIIRTLDIPVDDTNSYTKVIEALNEYFAPKKNILYERFVFYNRSQKQNEPIDDFVRDLKELSSSCEFTNVSEMVRDRIVLGIADSKLQEKLLKMENIEIEKIILECRIYEKQKEQVKAVQESKKSVDVVKKNCENNSEGENIDFINKEKKGKKIQKKINNYNEKCTRCFKVHKINNCPAFGKICNKCKKLNHFSIACRSNINVNALNQNDSDSSNLSCDFALTDSIDSQNIKDIWYHNIMIENHSVKFKLDTGSDANIIPISKLKEILKNPNLKPTSVTLQTYSGHKIYPLGEISLSCVSKDNTANELFLVVKDGYKPILSRDSCVKLGLVKRIYNMEKSGD